MYEIFGVRGVGVPKGILCAFTFRLEPVIIMSPAEMTVGPNRSQIKFGPL